MKQLQAPLKPHFLGRIQYPHIQQSFTDLQMTQAQTVPGAYEVNNLNAYPMTLRHTRNSAGHV